MRDMYDYIKNIVLDIITHPFKTVITFLFMVMFLIIINSCATTHEPFHLYTFNSSIYYSTNKTCDNTNATCGNTNTN